MWMTSRFLLVAVALPSVATFQLSGLRSIGASGPRNVRAMRARASKNGERDSPRADATDELVAAVARGADAPYSPPERERIAQLVLVPVVQAEFELVNEFDSTERGSGGFGHTGTV